jgi:translocation and assembly module TamB
MQWDQWALEAAGDRQALDLSVLATGALDRPLAVDARATLCLDAAERALILRQALLQVGPDTYTLRRPALVLRDSPAPNEPMHYVLHDWQWRSSGATLTWGGWLSRERLNLRATLADLAVRHLPLAHAKALAGLVQGVLQIQGSFRNPCIEWTSAVAGLGLLDPGRDQVTALDGQLSLRLTASDLTADVTLTTPAGDRVEADIGLPTTFSLWPPRWAQHRSDLVAHVKADADVRILDWLPVLREAVLEGRVVAEVTYRAAAGAGAIQGQARWERGRYEDILLGTVVQNVQVQLQGQGDRLVLTQGHATDGAEGRIRAQGELRMVSGLPYRIDIQAERFPWVQRADVTTVASGRVALTGSLHAMTVDGQLVLDYGLLNMDALPPAPPPLLTSRSRQTPAPDASAGEALIVQGSLTLDLRGGFRIYGSGLDSIWDGKIHLAKAGDHWDVTGAIAPRRGEFRLLGRPFRLTEGTIRMDGSWPIEPILDLSAVYRRKGIEALVHIAGRASQPMVQITSNPPLPEDAILATVLFGRDLATISAMQALQLAAAVRSLHTPGGGADVFQRTRQAIGVDTLEIRQGDDTSGTGSVAVGKYLAPEVYVELQQPLSRGGATSTHIEYEVRPNLTVETDAGPGIRPGIGINWKKDY